MTPQGDRLVRGLAATIIVVFILGVVLRAFAVIDAPQTAGAVTLAAASYLFGGLIQTRNGRRDR